MTMPSSGPAEARAGAEGDADFAPRSPAVLTPRRRRASERGAVLVETAIAIPVFIILLAGMLFLHNVVAKMQRVQLAARNSAWTKAMASCTGGDQVPQPDFTSRMDGAPGSSVSLTASPGEAKGSADDYASVAVLSPGPEAVSESSTVSFFQSVHSSAVVMCNSTTQPGDIPGVIQWFRLSDDFTLLFGGP